jgi:hypothetical protein
MFPSSDHHTSSLHHQLCSQPDQLVVMMLHPRMLEAVKDNKIDPMCEEAGARAKDCNIGMGSKTVLNGFTENHENQ